MSRKVMSGCLDFNAFAALLDESLTKPERQEALAHIARCTACQAMACDLGYEVPLAVGLTNTDLGAVAARSPQGHAAAAADKANPALNETAAAPDNVSAAVVRMDAEPLIGSVIAGYRVKRELGRGGMGAVYEAIHERMGQRAAVKVMFPQFSQDPNFIRRFRAGARAASVVRHPGLVTIFNHGQLPSGTAYIMMEFLAGESLSRRMQRKRRMVAAEALRIGRQIASALCAVHAHGIVHRDLKPDNVMLVPDADLPSGERTKVVDFGIAKLAAALHTNPGAAGSATGQQTFVGTVAYASPEQCRMSTTLDGKSDVYSLGIILYEMLSGDIPFTGSVSEVLGMHASTLPRPLRELATEVPPAVAALVHDMLAKSAQQRPTMAAVRDRIDGLAAGPSKPSISRPLIVAAVMLALLVAIVLRLLGRL